MLMDQALEVRHLGLRLAEEQPWAHLEEAVRSVRGLVGIAQHLAPQAERLRVPLRPFRLALTHDDDRRARRLQLRLLVP
jgi:hypothetical protein